MILYMKALYFTYSKIRGDLMLLHTFLFVFIAEMADKTQLMMMALTNRYRMKSVILGMMLGVIIISAFSTLAGDLIGDMIPMQFIKLAAAAMFLGFGFFNLRITKEESKGHHISLGLPIFTIAFTFILAELGDKTQLATVALSADHMDQHLQVFLGASLGLIMANIFGIFAGKFIFAHLSEDSVKVVSSFFFFLFGSITLFEAYPAAPFFYIIYSILIISIACMIYEKSHKEIA